MLRETPGLHGKAGTHCPLAQTRFVPQIVPSAIRLRRHRKSAVQPVRVQGFPSSHSADEQQPSLGIQPRPQALVPARQCGFFFFFLFLCLAPAGATPRTRAARPPVAARRETDAVKRSNRDASMADLCSNARDNAKPARHCIAERTGRRVVAPFARRLGRWLAATWGFTIQPSTALRTARAARTRARHGQISQEIRKAQSSSAGPCTSLPVPCTTA